MVQHHVNGAARLACWPQDWLWACHHDVLQLCILHCPRQRLHVPVCSRCRQLMRAASCYAVSYAHQGIHAAEVPAHQVAEQQGKWLAKRLNQMAEEPVGIAVPRQHFTYRSMGSMATVGSSSAVLQGPPGKGGKSPR